MSNDDLVPRLRVLSGCTEEGYEADIIQKAADRIEALEAKNAKLREMVTAQAEGAAQQAKENARLRAALSDISAKAALAAVCMEDDERGKNIARAFNMLAGYADAALPAAPEGE